MQRHPISRVFIKETADTLITYIDFDKMFLVNTRSIKLTIEMTEILQQLKESKKEPKAETSMVNGGKLSIMAWKNVLNQ